MAQILDESLVLKALDGVKDPEIGKPITELDMVESISISADGNVGVNVLLTVAGCPLKQEIIDRVTRAVSALDGVRSVGVNLGVMTEDQRKGLKEKLRGPAKEIQFNRADSLTKVYAVASGKGGVGKSSVTANLAAAIAAQGHSVGVIDADVYGHSIPRMLNATTPPTMVEGLIMPPISHGVKVISMLPFKPGGVMQAVAFRGPMLHRSLEQFLSDVWWGDLDFLLLDLPPGTGDIAISTAQLLPQAELLVVTTPQIAAAEVAVRAGMLSGQTNQRLAGVIENMGAFACPHCGQPIDMFGSGGGQFVADALSKELGKDVSLLGRIPFDVRLRESGDSGEPLVLAEPDAPASTVIRDIASRLASRPRGLVGMPLKVAPV